MMLTAQSEKKLIREAFSAIRQRGMRAKEAAEAIGLTEGVALAAFVGHETPDLQALPVQTALVVYPVKRQWIELLQALEDCGPVMALTRNETTVHEKTGIYQRVSGNQSMGLVMGADIDLRLFLSRWASGLVVVEPGAASDVHPKISLQFFDAQGVSVHKVFPVPATNRQTWHNVLAAWVDMSQVLQFNSEPESVDSRRHRHVTDPEILARDWAAMTDTHQFFDLLKRHDLDRLPALCLVQGRFTRKVTTAAVRFTLYQAAFNGLSIMVFVGNPGCIQIHTGPVKRIEPMDINGKQWLNVLDPAFNLHLREDMIDQVWVVEKPTEDGIVSSLEVFDAQGEVMAMIFGERKPGQIEQQSWKDLLAEIPLNPSVGDANL